MELDRIKFLRNKMWIYTNIGAIATVEIDEVSVLIFKVEPAAGTRAAFTDS